MAAAGRVRVRRAEDDDVPALADPRWACASQRSGAGSSLESLVARLPPERAVSTAGPRP